MLILTLYELDTDQPLTVICENICSLEQSKDSPGTRVTLTNQREYTVKETMLEICTMMQTTKPIPSVVKTASE